jgi:hypothetical protein
VGSKDNLLGALELLVLKAVETGPACAVLQNHCGGPGGLG